MMSKTQTTLIVCLTILSGLTLATALLKVMPFSDMNNLLIAGFLFPIITSTVLIAVVRGYEFSAMLKWYGGLLLVSLVVLFSTNAL